MAPGLDLLGGGGGWVHQLVVQLLSSQAVSIEQLAEISNNFCLQVSSALGLARYHTLNSLVDLSNNSCVLASKGYSGALDVLHRDVHPEH